MATELSLQLYNHPPSQLIDFVKSSLKEKVLLMAPLLEDKEHKGSQIM